MSQTEQHQQSAGPTHTSPDGWTLSQERAFIEDLLTKRIHFFLVVFAAVIGGAIAARQQHHLIVTLWLGFVVTGILACSVYRANFKLHLILNSLREQGPHPYAHIDDWCKRLTPVCGFSVRWLIGCYLPIACALLLGTGAVLAGKGVIATAPHGYCATSTVGVLAPPIGAEAPIRTTECADATTSTKMRRWLLGLGGVSLLLGTAATWALWRLLHWLVPLVGRRENWQEPDDLTLTPSISLFIGLFERTCFCILVAFGISGIGGAIGAWIAVKFAAGWQQVQTGGPWARAWGFAGLICSLVSLVFAVLGGLVCNGTLVLW